MMDRRGEKSEIHTIVQKILSLQEIFSESFLNPDLCLGRLTDRALHFRKEVSDRAKSETKQVETFKRKMTLLNTFWTKITWVPEYTRLAIKQNVP